MKRMFPVILISSTAFFAGGLAGVLSAAPPESPRAITAPPSAPTASAQLKPASGSKVSGTVNFVETPDGVRVVTEINGLSPGKHGFHVHEKGDCSDPGAKSAGEHFNPTSKSHGAPEAANHHLGDLGNLVADSTGHAALDTVIKGLTLSGVNAIVGKGLIVHAARDDLVSQPGGAAGERIACGVIETAKPVQ
jgi:superoxide dismutase, Cu-Zn family